MRIFIKKLLIVIAVLLAGVVGFTLFIGYAFYNALDDMAAETVVQRISDVDGNIAVHVPLQKEYGAVINGFRKCSSESGISDEPDYSSSCSDGICTIVLSFDEHVPDFVQLYVENGDECSYRRFNIKGKIEVVDYFAEIELNETLKKALNMPHEGYEISSLKSSGHFYYRIMGREKIVLHYGPNKVANDLLTIDDKTGASIVFE